jgi:hypothetical protein
MRMTSTNGTLRAGLLLLAITASWSAISQTAPAALPAPAAAVAAKPVAAAPAKPARPSDKSQWKDLSRPQQVALEPLMAEWDHMEAVRKQKWLDIANRYASMTPDEQQRVQERMRAWLKLTPEERRVARENYTLTKKIDKSQKSAQWEQYQQLPEEEKRKLAADAATKKQITNLPPKTQPKALAPIKKNAAAPCASGMLKNPAPAGPACIPAPAVVPAPAVTPASLAPPTTPAPGNPAVPVPNAK